MTNVYIDCEFNGFGGELISMALVTECGREWYEVVEYFDETTPWVAENVIPVLHKAPISRESFRRSFWDFMRTIEEPVVIADWYADLLHFFSMFAGRDHSESVDFPCRTEICNRPTMTPEIPHNALCDARAIRHSLAIR